MRRQSNNENGSFEIFVSEDGENFTSVDVVEGVFEYAYTPNEDFLTLYFKVNQTVDSYSVESNIVTVINRNNGNDIDNDGITDIDEIYLFFTDYLNPDTDNDGLSDGYELFTLNTNPLLPDTDENGISDADEDFDNDGLTNIQEYELNTDPHDEDTDDDGLIDGDEVNIHHTDPLLYDTDGDNVSDYDEIILGLNPNAAATNGTPDNERTFQQTIFADDWLFYSINTESNPYEVSLEITAAGVAENNTNVTYSSYAYSMKNEAILGSIPAFYYNENLKIDDIKINFDLDSSITEVYNNKYSDISDEFLGIKRFNVFKYIEDTNLLLPIETYHDTENNRVYAHKVAKGGIYEEGNIIATDYGINCRIGNTVCSRFCGILRKL